jgi:hypothetical protein
MDVEETYRALGKVSKLSRGNTGQSDEESGNEGLHLDCCGVLLLRLYERAVLFKVRRLETTVCIPETCYRAEGRTPRTALSIRCTLGWPRRSPRKQAARRPRGTGSASHAVTVVAKAF